MIRVTVHLHTILQRTTLEGTQRKVVMELQDNARANDLYELLKIELHPDAVILAVNGRIAAPDQLLMDGDHVRIMPAMSGGSDINSHVSGFQ